MVSSELWYQRNKPLRAYPSSAIGVSIVNAIDSVRVFSVSKFSVCANIRVENKRIIDFFLVQIQLIIIHENIYYFIKSLILSPYLLTHLMILVGMEQAMTVYVLV